MNNAEQKNSSNIDKNLQEELKKQLQNYKADSSKFSSYLETMKKIDQWLEAGAKQ